MRFKFLTSTALRAPEGDNGGGASNGSADGGAGSAGAGTSGSPSGVESIIPNLSDAGNQAGTQGAGDPAAGQSGGEGDGKPAAAAALKFDQRPDWLAEQFYDPKTGEVRVQELAKSQADLRAKLSTGDHKAPKDAAGYELDKIDFGDDAKAKAAFEQVIANADDPVLQGVLKAGVDLGVSKQAMQGIVAAYIKSVAPTIPPAFDAKAEMAQLGERAPQIVAEATEFGRTLVRRGFISDQDFAEFQMAFGTAGGLKVLGAIRNFYGEAPMDVRATQSLVNTDTAESLRQELAGLMADRDAGKNVDQRWAAYQQKAAKFYGTAPARSSSPRAA